MPEAPDSPFISMRPRRVAIIFGAIFVGIWAIVVVGFDLAIARDALRASASSRFTPVQATIISSDVSSHRSGGKYRSRNYKADIRYSYTVAGVEYVGKRLRYGEFSSSSSSSAKADAARFTPGTTVTAYYNPREPSQAVLQPGLTGAVRFGFLFLIPFNILFAAIVLYSHLSLRGGIGGPPHTVEDSVTRVRLSGLPAAMVGLAWALGASVVSILVGAAALGLEVSAVQLAVFVVLVASCGLLAAGWTSHRAASGAHDLVIDPVRKTLTIPPARLRDGARSEVAFMHIHDIDVANSTTTRINNRPVKDVVLVLTRSGAEERIRLRSWAKAAVANQFAKWLKQQIRS